MKTLVLKKIIFLLLALTIVGCGNRMFQPKFKVTGKNIGEVTIVDAGAKFYGFYHSWGILRNMCVRLESGMSCLGATFADYQGPYPEEATVWWTINEKRIERKIKVSTDVPKQFGKLELVFEINGENVEAKWVLHQPRQTKTITSRDGKSGW
jgi:hypothetical protein